MLKVAQLRGILAWTMASRISGRQLSDLGIGESHVDLPAVLTDLVVQTVEVAQLCDAGLGRSEFLPSSDAAWYSASLRRPVMKT